VKGLEKLTVVKNIKINPQVKVFWVVTCSDSRLPTFWGILLSTSSGWSDWCWEEKDKYTFLECKKGGGLVTS